MFAPSTTTGNLQISSNTPTLNNDKERALEKELANDGVPTHMDDDYYNPNLDSVHQTVEDVDIDSEHQTQRPEKHLMQDASAEVKKVLKKADRVSDMIMALKKYTTMARERFSGKWGKSSGTSKQFAQSTVRGDPCSLDKAIELLNKYKDLGNKAYVKISKALQQKDNRIVFIGMPEHRRKTWMEDIISPEED